MSRFVRLGELGTTFAGLSGKTKADFGRGNASYVTFLDVVNSTRLRGESLGRVRVEPGEGQNRVLRGDLLFNGSSETPEEVALSAVVDFDPLPETYLNSFCFGFRLFPDAHVDPMYLAYFFRSPAGRELVSPLSQGATRYNIAKTKLLKVGLHLPELRRQREVVEMLSDADALTGTLRRKVAKQEDVLQGMTRQLLTGQTRLPGFEGPWMRVRLEELGHFLKGRDVKRSDVRDSGIPCIRYGELYTAFNSYTTKTKSFVAPEVAERALTIQKGDLLFAGSGETREEIGTCVAYLGAKPAVAGGDIVVLRGDSFNPIYLSLSMGSPQVVQQKARAGQGDAVVHIYSSALAAIEVELPPRQEQDAIANVIVDARNEIDALRRRLAKVRAIKQGMIQDLMARRTRLPAEEAAA